MKMNASDMLERIKHLAKRKRSMAHEATTPSHSRLPIDVFLEIASHADQNTNVALSSTASWMRIALKGKVFQRVVLDSYEKLYAWTSREVKVKRTEIAHHDKDFQ